MTNSGPLKNYRQLIDYFETVCTSHLAVKSFKTGRISDIDIQTNEHLNLVYPILQIIYNKS